MKNVQRLAMLALIAVLLVVAGCSSGSTPPKQALQDAMKNMENINSYSSQMSLGIDNLELPAGVSQNGMDVTSVVLGMLKGAKLNIKAVYAKEPQRTDMELNLQLSGTTLTIPMILTAEKLYMKLPALPMLELPESAAGKFIELDLKALAEQQGTAAALDTASAQKFAQELGAIVLKHFDEKTYFSNVKAKDANLPDDVKAEQIIRFAIDDNNYKESVETIVNDMLPELLKVMASNESYLQLIQKSKEDIEKMQTDLDANKASMIDFLNENVKVNELSITGAINKDKQLTYEAGKVNVEYTDKATGNVSKINVHFDMKYSDLNKDPKFLYDVPTDAMRFEDLMKQMKLPLGL
ncbi:hypothetical protein PALU110988_25705 [Paenibacillus lupini]|uniref:hypothetical protein n=1 Tax=Paenibacillus lupini TaxID=1450204 RepID=UPI001421FE0B|nr:hypothetical protein [Paenibacillus lupini]NIK26780.1 outer membrane murein-binding lipoprotein Lpp [Paenibacillus lupini]